MKLEYFGIRIRCIYPVLEFIVFVLWIDIWTICVHLKFGLKCSCWVIFMVVYTHEITCFRGGVLSRNNIFCL